MIGGVSFRFRLFDTKVNCFSLPLFRAAASSDNEGWRMRAVPTIISTGGSPSATPIWRVVFSFVDLGAEFVYCRGGLLGQLIWVVLGVLGVLFLFRFVLVARELTMETRQAI